MAKRGNQRKEFEDAVRIGENNAAFAPRIERWCSHLKVEFLGGGLWAQMTKLPIGRMAIDCPHAKASSMQSMHLASVAAYFVNENCVGCPHHEELNPDNAGRDILRESERDRTARAAVPVRSEARQRLAGLVTGDLAQALKSAPTTEQSILELVAGLDDETSSVDAAKILLQAAELAPEFFSSLACEVIAEHLSELDHGGLCARVLRALGRKKRSLPPVAVDAALRCVDRSLCDDEVLALLGDHFAAGGELPSRPVVARILGHQARYSVDFVGPRADRRYPGQTHALQEIGKRDPELLASACQRRLEDPDGVVRCGTSMTMREVLPAVPLVGSKLVAPLAESLELNDTHESHHRSADREACRLLADIFALDPLGTQTELANRYRSAGDEAKELLFTVYEEIADAAANDRFSRTPPSQGAVDCLPQVLDATLLALVPDKPLEVREHAARAIETITHYHPSVASPRSEAIFGILALLAQEDADLRKAHPNGDPLVPSIPHGDITKCGIVSDAIAKALSNLAKSSPQTIASIAQDVLAPLDAKNPAHVLLTARVLPLFVPLAEDHATGPKLVPMLFRCLMDVGSTQIRVSALKVIKEWLRLRPELVPENMQEIVRLYLRDPLVAIHKAAARAAPRLDLTSTEDREWVASALLAQHEIYTDERWLDWQHAADVLGVLVRICNADDAFFVRYALPAIRKQLRASDEWDARGAMRALRNALSRIPRLAPEYIEAALDSMVRFPDRLNQGPPSGEDDEYASLFGLPTSDIVGCEPEIREAIRTSTAIRPGLALQLIGILSFHELYRSAADAAEDLSKALAANPRAKFLREEVDLTAALARAEVAVQAGDPRKASEILRDASILLTEHVASTNGDDPRSFIEAFTMARRVAERIE